MTNVQDAREFGEEYLLITNEQDIAAALSYVAGEHGDIASMLVLLGDGEYAEVWGSEHPVPWDCIPYHRLPLV